jgi:hypothetical protein
LFRSMTFAASAAIAGLLLSWQPASAASMGQIPAAPRSEAGLVSQVQYWGESDYWDERPYRAGRRNYDRFEYYDDPPPRYQRQRQRDYGAPEPRYAPRQGQIPRQGQTGCYVPPPRPHSTPRLVCRY